MYNSDKFYRYSIDFLQLLSNGFCIVFSDLFFGAGPIRYVCFIWYIVIIMCTALADWMTSQRSSFKLSMQHVANNKTHLFSSKASCLHWTNEAKLVKSDAGKWFCLQSDLVCKYVHCLRINCQVNMRYRWIGSNIWMCFKIQWKRYNRETSKSLKFKGLHW